MGIAMPQLEFIPIHSEEELEDFVSKSPWECLVYLRQKYSYEDKWEYLIEIYTFDDLFPKRVWLYDWWEGQQNVEYLGVAEIKV